MAIAGYGGAVYVGTNKVAEIKSWSLELGGDTIDVTSFDSGGWKEHLASLAEWSGSFEGMFDTADTNGQVALINAWLNRQSVTLKLYVDNTHYFTGTAYINLSLEVPVDDAVTISVDFTGSGAVSYV